MSGAGGGSGAWITITKAQLEAVLLRWEQNFRDGKTRAIEETLALPAEQVAAESADRLWADLNSGRPT